MGNKLLLWQGAQETASTSRVIKIPAAAALISLQSSSTTASNLLYNCSLTMQETCNRAQWVTMQRSDTLHYLALTLKEFSSLWSKCKSPEDWSGTMMAIPIRWKTRMKSLYVYSTLLLCSHQPYGLVNPLVGTAVRSKPVQYPVQVFKRRCKTL